MAKATVMKGGNVRVYLGNNADPIVYSVPCGLTSRSVTLARGLQEETIPDCDDPDKVDWIGRGVSSLSMEISGEGVLAQQSVQTWLSAMDNAESTPAKVDWIFPEFTITWEGKMQVDSFQITAPNGEVVKASISMKSDGEMVRVVKAKNSTENNGN